MVRVQPEEPILSQFRRSAAPYQELKPPRLIFPINSRSQRSPSLSPISSAVDSAAVRPRVHGSMATPGSRSVRRSKRPSGSRLGRQTETGQTEGRNLAPRLTLVPADLTCHTTRGQWATNERSFGYRMDRRDVESGSRLYEGQSRLQILLRRDIGRTLSRRRGASIRARLRSATRTRQARTAAPLATAAKDFRELDERPFSRRHSGQVHRACRRRHAPGVLASVSGAHETTRANARIARGRTSVDGRSAECGVRRERRRSALRLAASSRAATDARTVTVPVGRTASRRSRHARSSWDRLGDRRRRERPARAADAACVGHTNPSCLSRAGRTVLFQAMGRHSQTQDRPHARRADVRRVSCGL